MGTKHLILCGCVTDQCVAHAVMDACDLGYYVTLVPGWWISVALLRCLLDGFKVAEWDLSK